MTTTTFVLTDLVLDPAIHVRAAVDQQIVNDYAEAMGRGAVFPPVVAVSDGAQTYLADGWHRWHAATRVGFATINAEVRAGTKEDALWYALGANKTNGKRLSSADKRHAIQLALQMWPDRSGALIAEQVGCSPMYVSTIKAGLSTTLVLPDRVTGRDGVSYPASPSAALTAREEAKRLLAAGHSVEQVRQTTKIGRETLRELRRGLGLAVDKTQAGKQARLATMRQLAEDGHSSPQIAAAVGVSVASCRTTMRRAGIIVHADRVVRGTHHHKANRIIERIVGDAENLTEGVQLVDFTALDPHRIDDWIASLTASKRAVDGLIKRLKKAKADHDQIHRSASVQDSARADRADADPARVGDPTGVS